MPEGQPPPLIGLRNPVEHKQRRRLWDRAFNTAAMKNYDEIIIRRVRELINQFEHRAGQEVDLSMWMSFFS
jgi:cytochrome P450